MRGPGLPEWAFELLFSPQALNVLNSSCIGGRWGKEENELIQTFFYCVSSSEGI